jgi:hypothetical protein
MIEAIRNMLHDAISAETPAQKDSITQKAIRRLDSLAKRVDPARFGQKGGTKTAERGPDYFRQIAAMRKTRAGGRPKKQDGTS